MSNVPPKPVSVKFSSVIHLTVDNYYLRGFGLISISVSLRQVFPWGKKKLHKRLYALSGILAYISHSALCLHHGFVHGSIHLFVALPISMVQEGLRKRLILPGGQYPDHVLHSFAGPAPPLPFYAIAVEPVIRFFCVKKIRNRYKNLLRIFLHYLLNDIVDNKGQFTSA